ncbi:hypothetical protein Q9L58_001948 [Maublancomyces gigas]|uniref:Fungal STAND N-terminal Goodbye domain-containing protein n=1 Tax=Discina gigas TaxID=1032678 RepID=A0ABR3GSY6_9PEZI
MTTAQGFGKAATVQFKTRSPVFVLDAPSFQHLQLYLQAATSLPSTEEKFRDHFIREHFDVYFENDKPLYEDLQKILIAISLRCGAFQDVLIPTMLVLASNISKFASEANTQYATIRTALVIATAPNARLTTKAVKDAYNDIGDELESLISSAGTRGKECVALAAQLTKTVRQFRRETVSDKGTLDPLHVRFANVIPDGEEVSKAMDRITKAAVAEAEKQGDIARAARKKTDDGGFGLPPCKYTRDSSCEAAWLTVIIRGAYDPVP